MASRVTVLALAALLPLLAACNQRDEVAEVPSVPYAGFMQGGKAPTGELFGKVRFPSAYTQRSATIVIDGNEFITGPDGRFRIREVPQGQHDFVVQIKGFERVSRAIWVDAHRVNHVGSIPLQFARGMILGRMVDEKGNSAVRVSVHLKPYDGYAVTDTEGIFQFLGVNSGNHMLTVEDSNFALRAREIQLRAGEQRNLGIITLQRLSSLSYSEFPRPHAME